MSKKQIFIGSSKEGLQIANTIKDSLEKIINAECTVWNQFGVFQINKSALESLMRGRFMYDFVILVATKDDIARVRGVKLNVPRDNVIFEFGLYLGALGDSRTIIFQEEGAKLPTDLLGLTLPRYSVKRKNVEQEVSKVAEIIKKTMAHPEIQLLPSTALAVGYFYSFIKDVTTALHSQKNVLTIKTAQYPCNQVTVVLPLELSDNISEKASVFYSKHKLDITEIESSGKRPFKIQYAYDKAGADKVKIIDIPTTLNTIRHCCSLLLIDPKVGVSDAQKLIEKRELFNFKQTLEILISQNDYCKNCVTVLWEDEFTI